MLNFELRGNYIVLTSSDNVRKEYIGHAKDVFIYKDTNIPEGFYVEGLRDWNKYTRIPYSDITGFASVAGFIDWYSENTGEPVEDLSSSGGATASLQQDGNDSLENIEASVGSLALDSIEMRAPLGSPIPVFSQVLAGSDSNGNLKQVLIDDSGNQSVVQAFRSAIGSITTRNLVPNGVPTANSSVEIDLQGTSLLSIQTTGTYTGALSIQITNNNSRWETITASSIVNFVTGAYTSTIASATIGLFLIDVGSFLKARITGLSTMTGTVNVTLRTSSIPLSGLNRALPTGANVLGAVTQSGSWTASIGNTPNTTPMLANPLLPATTTTGDTGAKIATGNGATQTNATSKGATIVFNIGAVTGILPTAVFKIQGSSDAGTTWYDIPNATTASIKATGAYGIQIYPGVTPVAGVATSNTIAEVSVALPRTWRVVWTIGGATPSFTITNVQVAYII